MHERYGDGKKLAEYRSREREEEAGGMHRTIRLHRCTPGQVIALPGIPEDRD